MQSGYSTNGTPYGNSSTGSMGVIALNGSSGTGHVMDITGMQDASTYYYYDPQTQQTGTISTTDPRIFGVYSVQSTGGAPSTGSGF